MRSSRPWLVVGVMLVVVSVAGAGWAGELEDKGRAVFEQYHKAVVTVQLVIKDKFSMPGMGSEENEYTEEATGIVIDPSGLMVLALSTTDPSGVFDRMASALGPQADQFKRESNIVDLKMLLHDGTELPGKVVLRDKDLDLAFVQPDEAPAEPLASIDLSKSGAPALLDNVVALNRLGKVANRAYAAGFERIQAIMDKPRTFYIPGNDPTHTTLGSPVFTLDGKVVGLFVLRAIKTSGGGRGSMFGSSGQGAMAIIVPAEDILEAAKQVPER